MEVENESIQLYLGDALSFLPKIEQPIRAVITSPPYAEQRAEKPYQTWPKSRLFKNAWKSKLTGVESG